MTSIIDGYLFAADATKSVSSRIFLSLEAYPR